MLSPITLSYLREHGLSTQNKHCLHLVLYGIGRGKMKDSTSRYHHGDLKNALVEAALLHIRKHREVSFTLRELAQNLGVSSAAPFRHFETKRALLAKIAEIGFEKLNERFLLIDQEHKSNPVSSFQHKGIAYVEFAVSNQAHFLVMSHAELSCKNDFPLLKSSYEQLFGSLRSTIEDCKNESLLDNYSSNEVVLAAWSAVHGLAMLWVSGLLAEPLGLTGSRKAATQAAEMTTLILAKGFLKGRA